MNHIARRHAHERQKVAKMREFSEPIKASDQLPADQRDWCCPFCPKALPFLSKHLKGKSVRHHYKTQHPKRKIEAGRLTKIRWKMAKKDPSKVLNYREGKRSLSRKLKQRALDRYDFKQRGHDICVVPVDWSSWPRSPKSAYRKGDTLFTCVKCCGWTQSNWSYDCPGLKNIPRVGQAIEGLVQT